MRLTDILRETQNPALCQSKAAFLVCAAMLSGLCCRYMAGQSFTPGGDRTAIHSASLTLQAVSRLDTP